MKNAITSKIQALLADILPSGCFLEVKEFSILGGNSVKIFFAASDKEVNRVQGQHPQAVSLCLDVDTMDLYVQHYGCMGGQMVYREIDKDNPKERFLAMKGIPVPFRKPKKEEKFVLNAIAKFAENWKQIIKENKDKLKYQDLADYSIFE